MAVCPGDRVCRRERDRLDVRCRQRVIFGICCTRSRPHYCESAKKSRGRQAHREVRSRLRELVEMGGVVWEGAVVGEEGSKERGFVD